MSKHTPGPYRKRPYNTSVWRGYEILCFYGDLENESAVGLVGTPAKNVAVTLGHQSDECIANACLFEAAPDLFRELEKALSAIKKLTHSGEVLKDTELWNLFADIEIGASNALHKAEGRTNVSR